jgi:Arm DNA-binding domain
MTLTENIIRNSVHSVKPVKLNDGHGLFLLLTPAGGKWWRFRYRFGGKQKMLSMGVYPEVSLKKARNRRDVARKLLADDIDPGENRKQERAARLNEAVLQLSATRFTLGSDGALSFILGKRYLALTPAETSELRHFLEATRDVLPKATPCP